MAGSVGPRPEGCDSRHRNYCEPVITFLPTLARETSMKALVGSLVVVALIGCGGADNAAGPPAPRFVLTLDSCASASITVEMVSATSGATTTASLTVRASPDSLVFASLSAGQYGLGLFGSWPGVTGPYASLFGNIPAVTVPGRQTIVCSGGRPAPYVLTFVPTTPNGVSGGCLVDVAVGKLVSDGSISQGPGIGGPTVFGTGITHSFFVPSGGASVNDTLFLPQGDYTGGATVYTSYSAPDYFGYDLPQWSAPVPGGVSLSC